MADQEKEHAEKFRILGKEFRNEKMEYIDIENAGECLRSYVEGRIIPSLEAMWNKVKDKDILDVMDYAINLEKDSP